MKCGGRPCSDYAGVYCFSYISTFFIFWPLGPVPLLVKVINLRSSDTTLRDVFVTLPDFLSVVSTVLALIRRCEMVSYVSDPRIGYSF
jgi:hypothetical protein